MMPLGNYRIKKVEIENSGRLWIWEKLCRLNWKSVGVFIEEELYGCGAHLKRLKADDWETIMLLPTLYRVNELSR